VINSISNRTFNSKGIVRVPFSTAFIDANRDSIIDGFKKNGFGGELRLGGGFDGNGNEHVLYDLNKMEPSEALQWIKDNSDQTK
jgi:hypothetical protein